MNYNNKINFKFLEYLYQHCDSKDLHEMHLKNVLNGKEKIINDIDIFILRGKEVLEYMFDNKEYNISNIKNIYYIYTKEKFLDDNLLNNIIKIYDNDIDKEIIKTILEAMLNIKVELNIKSYDYFKFITNDINNEKLRVY